MLSLSSLEKAMSKQSSASGLYTTGHRVPSAASVIIGEIRSLRAQESIKIDVDRLRRTSKHHVIWGRRFGSGDQQSASISLAKGGIDESSRDPGSSSLAIANSMRYSTVCFSYGIRPVRICDGRIVSRENKWTQSLLFKPHRGHTPKPICHF